MVALNVHVSLIHLHKGLRPVLPLPLVPPLLLAVPSIPTYHVARQDCEVSSLPREELLHEGGGVDIVRLVLPIVNISNLNDLKLIILRIQSELFTGRGCRGFIAFKRSRCCSCGAQQKNEDRIESHIFKII